MKKIIHGFPQTNIQPFPFPIPFQFINFSNSYVEITFLLVRLTKDCITCAAFHTEIIVAKGYTKKP